MTRATAERCAAAALARVPRIDLRCTAYPGAVYDFSARPRVPMVAAVDQQDAPHRRAPPLVDHRRRRVVKAIVEQAGQRVATKRRVTAPEVHGYLVPFGRSREARHDALCWMEYLLQ